MLEKIEEGIVFFILGMLFLIAVFGIYAMFECMLKSSIAAIIATIVAVIAFFNLLHKYIKL